MFKYPKATNKEENSKAPAVEAKSDGKEPVSPVVAEPGKKDVSPEALRELLEKNLKWSQIIYEQTRKINSKLFWKSVWGWMLFLIFFVVPTILGVWFIPSALRDLQSKYQPYLSMLGGGAQTSTMGASSSTDDILKLLPISDEQKASLKAILGTK